MQYRRPGASGEATNTPYLLVTGEDAMFQATKETLLSDVQDGLGKTIMIVEFEFRSTMDQTGRSRVRQG